MRLATKLSAAAVMAGLWISCQNQQPGNTDPLPQYDTLESLLRTDTGYFRRYSYFIGGLEAITETQRIISPDSSAPYMRSAFGYDSLGNRILTIHSLYDSVKQDFVHDSRVDMEYDMLHNPTSITTYTEVRNKWKPQDRSVRTYDSRQNVESQEIYSVIRDKFVIRQKFYYKYDSSNNLVEETSYEADSAGVWYPVQKIQKEYSGSLPTVELTYKPDRKNQWVPSRKVEHQYNVSSQRVETVAYTLRQGRWTYNVKSEYQYGESGAMTSTRTLFYDEASRKWVFQKEENY